MDYMVYAYLQLARDADARRMVEASRGVTGVTPRASPAPYALAAMPARYAVERGDWAAGDEARAAAEQLPVHRGA